MKNIIAIDVGNGFCKAAILLDAAKDPVDLITGTRDSMRMGLPSVAYVQPNGKITVNPKKIPVKCDTVRDVKTHLGKAKLPLSVGNTEFSVDPGDVYGAVAGELVRLANEKLKELGKEPACQVVVTYPSEFIDTPKPGIMKRSIEQQVLDGHNLEVVAMLPEPVAAAIDTLYYEENIKSDAAAQAGRNIAVYDLGHGTLDLAVVSSTGDRSKPFDVVCQFFPVVVDVCGRVFDEKIYDRLLRQMDPDAVSGLAARDRNELRYSHAVRMKHDLTEQETASANFIVPGTDDFLDLTLSLQEFESMISADISRTVECVAQLLQDAQRKNVSVQEIILTGGASQIPLIERMLTQTFGSAGIRVRSFRPSHAVVNGAARYAQQLVVQQRAEYAYGLYVDSAHAMYTMIKPDDTLTVRSAPLTVTANDSSMSLRVCRAKDRHTEAQTVPYGACDEVRRFPFESRKDQSYQIALTIDEDRCLTITCTDPDGTSTRQSIFDQFS